MNKRYKLRYASELAGTFVILGIVTLVAGIFLAANRQGWFEKKFILRVEFDTKSGSFGLKEGNEVEIMNIPAGRVGKIVPNEDGHMETTFIMKEAFRQFIRIDSVAMVKKKFVAAGDSFVEIKVGEGAVIEDGAIIKCEKDVEMMEKAEKVLTDVQDVVMPLVKEVNELLVHANAIMKDMEEGTGIVGAAISDEQMKNDVKRLVVNASSLTEEAEQTFVESTLLLKAAQKSWLLRKHVKAVEAEEAGIALHFSDDDFALIPVASGRGLQVARAHNDSSAIVRYACELALFNIEQGRYERAGLLLDEALAEQKATGANDIRPIQLRARLLAGRGNVAEALKLIDDNLMKLKRIDRLQRVELIVLAGEFQNRLGKSGAARKSIEDAEKDINKIDSVFLKAGSVSVLARSFEIEKRYEKAAVLYDVASDCRRLTGQYELMTKALISAGEAYALAGDHADSADRYFRAGRSLLSKGDRPEAKLVLARAMVAAEKIDDSYVAAQVQALLADSDMQN